MFSCPLRRDGAPAVPARWLQRLDALLRATGQALPSTRRRTLGPCPGPSGAPPRPGVRRPPRVPPLSARPAALRVTEIETWLRDPYAIYARHVLALRALPMLEEPADAADYGSVVHAAVHAFLREAGTRFPPDADVQAGGRHGCGAGRAGPAPGAWRPGGAPACAASRTGWPGAERERRLGAGLATIASEKDGTWLVPSASCRSR